MYLRFRSLVRRRRRRRGLSRNHRLQMSLSVPDVRSEFRAASVGSLEGDWSATLRPLAEPHRLSLEGLNLETSLPPAEPGMNSGAAHSRQQLLEDVLQTKQLLQIKQRHKHNGGWTLTAAQVLNSADRAEAQVQLDAYRKQLLLRQRKMSTTLKAQTLNAPVSKSRSDVSCDLRGREEFQQRLQQLDCSIRQSERTTAETVTQIRQKRQRQLNALHELGVSAADLTSAGVSSPAAAAAADVPDSPEGVTLRRSRPPAAGGPEGVTPRRSRPPAAGGPEGVTLRRPRPPHSPSSPRRRTPLRFISVLSRNKRSSGSADWDDAPASDQAPPLRSTVSEEALREIARFEKLMEAYLNSRRSARQLAAVQHFV